MSLDPARREGPPAVLAGHEHIDVVGVVRVGMHEVGVAVVVVLLATTGGRDLISSIQAGTEGCFLASDLLSQVYTTSRYLGVLGQGSPKT